MREPHRWELLRDWGFQALDYYRDVVEPGPLQQNGLRYINGIDVDPDRFRLGDYVSAESNLIPGALLDESGPFSLRLERTTDVTPQFHRREVVSLAAQPISPRGGRMLLDVDQLTVWAAGPEGSGMVQEVYEEMHDAVLDLFERVIQPVVLESFGPVHS